MTKSYREITQRISGNLAKLRADVPDRPLWSLTSLPSLGERAQVIAQFAGALRELGPANFLYCDGDALFAHADRRHQNDGSIRAPGMWRLARRCPAGGELAAEGLRITSDGGEQEVLLVASVPLTHEDVRARLGFAVFFHDGDSR